MDMLNSQNEAPELGAPELSKPSEDEIRPLAAELYHDTNCEPDHDVINWKSAEGLIEQKRRVQAEIEKAARQGHF